MDKGGVTNKVLGQMMIKCTEEISPSAMDIIMPFKQDASMLDAKPFLNLIEIDWEAITELALPDSPEAQQQIRLTPQESRMTTEVEELSEEMRRENENEMRDGMNKMNIAFFDLTNLSLAQELAYLVFILGFFAALAGVFYKLLFTPEEDYIAIKKAENKARKGKKAQ